MQTPLKLLTFNVRYDQQTDSPAQPFAAPPKSPTLKHEQAWAIRKWKIADTVLIYEPDIVAFQEAVYHQVVDLEALLVDYDWVGVGRDDGAQKGEYCAVFYKRFKREDGQIFTVMNTHFDHRGIEARQNSATLLLEQAKNVEGVVILVGDLNSPEDDPAYLTLTAARYQGHKDGNATLRHLDSLNDKAAAAYAQKTGHPVRTGENNITLPTHRVLRRPFIGHQQEQEEESQPVSFLDARYELITRLKDGKGLSGPYGYSDTFTSFGEGEDAEKAPLRLDYILHYSSTPVNVLQFGVLCNQYDDGLYISDHRPVIAKLAW
ncbi:hypothetical protein EC973_004360 [Apophysomyces ossiformis]|uniref:Endonuclease/exonuclease/phosphatase domain-containing protein n=1 Tax=Apophysomyces ossiformis TaxID=679940 RepID=A0A8H7BGX1_9FUNG|nr:hypothetical protein EC973_004360 [Apophysomyces ossiformis]